MAAEQLQPIDTRIAKIDGSFEGKLVKLKGWVYKRRDIGGAAFLMLRDGSGVIQVAFKRGYLPPEQYEVVRRVGLESSCEITGIVKTDPRAPGGLEVHALSFKLVGECRDYPIAKKSHGVEFLLDHRHLWIRSPKVAAILRIRAELLKAAREWFEAHDYVEVTAPSIVTAAVEGGATLFELEYFGRKAYLTQSSQFYLEAAIFSLGRAYTIQPSFRAEKSRTRRHLTEFTHMEGEAAFMDLNQLMAELEDLVSYICRAVAEKRKRELEDLRRRFTPPEPPFPRISYDEAIEIAQSKGVPIEWGEDLSTESERAVASEFEKPVLVHRYPREVKAFYHKPDPENPKVVLCTDMLAPEDTGEIIGGGQRIHDYQELVKRIEECGLNMEDYEWYLDLRRYGSVPHSGFGLGVERVVKWICGLSHIREATLIPRTPVRVYP